MPLNSMPYGLNTDIAQEAWKCDVDECRVFEFDLV